MHPKQVSFLHEDLRSMSLELHPLIREPLPAACDFLLAAEDCRLAAEDLLVALVQAALALVELKVASLGFSSSSASVVGRLSSAWSPSSSSSSVARQRQ